VQDNDLHEFASKIGKVKSCEVASSQGKSRGYGVVEYESDRDAEDAIQDLNDTELLGRRVFVREVSLRL
jgi:polyadenylate-binding protein